MRLGRITTAFGLDRLTKRVDRFRRDEDGVMVIFTLYLLIAMLIVTGLSIDLARVEIVRTRLQNTLDRAILAASSLDSRADTDAEVKALVNDYFDKVGLGEFIDDDDIIVEGDGRTSRAVQATASANVPSWFLQYVGINEMLAPAAGRAEEGVENIEIVLVLDVSGSMGSWARDAGGNRVCLPDYKDTNGNSNVSECLNSTIYASKLDILKASAYGFVNKVLSTANASERVTIGIVAYNGQVALNDLMLSEMQLGGDASATSRCAVFPDAEYDSLTINMTAGTYDRWDMFDMWNDTNTWYADRTSELHFEANSTFCSSHAGQRITLPTNDLTTLQNAIEAMVAQGYTSIDTGTKWGAALLDPSMRPFLTKYASERTEPGPNPGDEDVTIPAVLPTILQGRPADYNGDRVTKYLIVMSDGENTQQYATGSNYDDGVSNIYKNGSTYYAYFEDGYEVTVNTGTRWRPNWETTEYNYYSYNSSNGNTSWQQTLPGSATNLTWPQVFEDVSFHGYSYYLYGDPKADVDGNNNQWSNYRDRLNQLIVTRFNADEMDERLDDLCDVIRAQGAAGNKYYLYTIAFTAPQRGREALSECALGTADDRDTDWNTSDNYIIARSAADLGTAFDGIAANISKLRLTQ